MLQKEFETLTGKTVTTEDYAAIDRIYMAAYGMGKQEFCAAWRENDMRAIVDELTSNIDSLEKKNDTLTQRLHEADEKNVAAATAMLRKAEAYKDNELKRAAIELVGLKTVVRIDLKNLWQLNEEEREYVLDAII